MPERKRDSEVVRLQSQGVSHRVIAEQFGISPSRVGQIIAASELEEQQETSLLHIQQILKSTDNIDKKWPRETIMECLRLPKVISWRLERHFKKESILELSLRDLMDFLIPERVEIGQDLFQAMPALARFNVGRKTYNSLVRSLSWQDLGETFNNEWTRRICNLLRYLEEIHAYIPSELMDIPASQKRKHQDTVASSMSTRERR